MTTARHIATVETSALDSRHHFPQVWLLILLLVAFGIYVAWDRNLLALVYALDRSYMALVISALVIVATGHAALHILRYSRLLDVAHRLLDDPSRAETGLLSDYLDDLEQGAGGESLVEVYAERLRAPVDLGWFLADLAIRLGLLGTIIGFILIFTSLSGVSLDAADGLKDLLVAMSGGMGTALLTTLCGLVAATVISLQYLVLSRASDHLVGQLVRLRLRRAAPADTVRAR